MDEHIANEATFTPNLEARGLGRRRESSDFEISPSMSDRSRMMKISTVPTVAGDMPSVNASDVHGVLSELGSGYLSINSSILGMRSGIRKGFDTTSSWKCH